ncbi:unnamed protein product [Effrenium voratum]|uniref:PDZ domain-containing protein n=1 Tax=Effrenium voratum TaxID=2562239 RepID=A0AA36I2X4_9DINO|nr:unnamed protein product [Effrenium voratum]CAJ1379222.1 unnamed protein product [Effrenium voratum]CAJ1461069.1 unnamed protein product [Effrenium voratum]|mmetsp:Transcript_20303/g.48141  ORF Transcript_20303/g.48141 Transcript_20303/m.48141 type:complete len:293 (-) Transcript_20303:130-1008(-)|eukprot:CAMPEP_0181444888 /NCGR_PEP_ID=MMETSP1110-20121109/25306_1 /TAXON_ID=174948 /ORGANISM="Symbiodinium sp., Strain CCMP421" /LENGTH=292 /DNA_ID=CAMNT_0023568919 /DNA_START=58 /DNA_END=936 /DNA_ORIENTATION=+
MSQVQAPPGLEAVSCHHAVCSGAANAGGAGGTGAVLAEDLKAELIRQVTEACQQQVSLKTEEAVEALWKRGQKAITSMQQQHAASTEQLRSQLAACTESYRSLERETVVLRANLEAMMKHLTLLFGVPPHCSASFPSFDQVGLPEDEEPSPLPVYPTDEAVQAQPAQTSGTGSETVPSPTSLAEQTSSSPASSTTFTLTLRRADTVPAGLMVQGEDGLLVERVLPGGAVEAWNRQCPGDFREIRPGDRIISINGQEDPCAMHQEFLTKYLLKMTVRRDDTLRADAEEFVLQA